MSVTKTYNLTIIAQDSQLIKKLKAALKITEGLEFKYSNKNCDIKTKGAHTRHKCHQFYWQIIEVGEYT